MKEILVLYYSLHGSVKQLAQHLAHGVDSVPGMRARVRTVPKVMTESDGPAKLVPDAARPSPAMTICATVSASPWAPPPASATWRRP
jgi:hypothetical protein